MAADVILVTPLVLSTWHDVESTSCVTGLGVGGLQALKTEPNDRVLSGACCSWDHPQPPR